ncbi:hypothetical protein DYU05_01265 [Mucilaginibacter terrenus]|uniref:Uncharacterized protein n=2 Tax=Mucilaginibacter terrenus TaxID=2482727 RepID=A0A3E2NTF3_9SPHI|nr:hypothetical protein DYU05_01265 [Mucilaginibacter terrenus]
MIISLAHGQARSSIGLSGGFNQSFHKWDKEHHYGFGLIGNVRISPKFAIEPAIATREVKDYATARLSAKYYPTNNFFVAAGPFFWVGSDLYNNFGFTSSVGYRVLNMPYSNLELSVHGNFARYKYDGVPVVGARAAFNFNFKK